MKRDLFEDVVAPSIEIGERRWYSVPLSIVTHVIVVAALVIVPFTATIIVPTPQSVLAFAIAPPAPPAPPPPAVPVVTPPQPVAETPPLNVDAAPLSEPEGISDELPPMPAIAGPPSPLPPSSSSTVGFAPPATVTLTTPPPPSRPIPVGGAVQEPRKLHHVAPIYPTVARTARLEGVVILEATIGKDGSVREAKVLRSNAMFDQAAVDAVRQWRYTTPTLNGIPVDVTMTVTVRFLLR